MTPRTPARYNRLLIALHWATFVLIALAYALSELREAFEHTAAEAVVQRWHASLGLTVLGLAALRLAVRAVSKTPAIEPPPPRWQAAAAAVVHAALYGLMLALPLTGWLMTNADGATAAWFGMPLPRLVGPSERLEDFAEDVHEAIASAGYALIGLHAAAALFHHYVVRDNTLRLMWPLARPR